MKKFLRAIALPTVMVVLAFLCSQFFFRLLLIQGDSMLPAYHNLQLAILDKRSDDYSLGDVVAFSCEGLGSVLVKRIAAVPGDTVSIQDHRLFVNGSLSEMYSQTEIQAADFSEETLTLAENQFFVLGDNLSQSVDSRDSRVGLVSRADIEGKLLSPKPYSHP